MGIETALIVGGLGVASAIGKYNSAKSNARKTATEGIITMANRKKEIQQLAAKQKIGYIQAGVEMEGTAQAVVQDTYNTGIADILSLNSAYKTNIKNQLKTARAELIGNIAQAGMSAYSAYSMASMANAAQASGLSAEQMSIYNANSTSGGFSTGWTNG